MHLSRNEKGRWRAIVQLDGTRRSFTADTRAEARRLATDWEYRHGRRPAEIVTVDDIVHLHFHQLRGRRSPVTIQTYEALARRLPTHFLQRNVIDVDARTVSALFDELVDDGMSPHTVHKVRVMLGGAWSRAITSGFDVRNPIRMVPSPPTSTPEFEPPSPEEVNRLLDAAESDQHRLFIRLAAATGCRRGELCALQWRDVDLEENMLVVRRSVIVTRKGGLELRETKTGRKGHRVIAVGDITMQHVRRWRRTQVEQALAAGLPEPVFLFSTDGGVSPWRPEYPTSWFIKLRNQTGVGCRLHDLRHFAATQLLAGGMSLAQVAGRLGHSSVATTAATYAHWVPAQDQVSADILDKSLHG